MATNDDASEALLDPLAVAFGRRVVELRAEQEEMTAVKLAGIAGMSPAYLWRVEAGKTDVSLRNTARLAAAFGITISQLLKGVDTPDLPAKRKYSVSAKVGRPPKNK